MKIFHLKPLPSSLKVVYQECFIEVCLSALSPHLYYKVWCIYKIMSFEFWNFGWSYTSISDFFFNWNSSMSNKMFNYCPVTFRFHAILPLLLKCFQLGGITWTKPRYGFMKLVSIPGEKMSKLKMYKLWRLLGTQYLP